MTIGAKVTHKLTGQTMTILRFYGSVAVLQKDIPEPYVYRGIEYEGDICICQIENLTL